MLVTLHPAGDLSASPGRLHPPRNREMQLLARAFPMRRACLAEPPHVWCIRHSTPSSPLSLSSPESFSVFPTRRSVSQDTALLRVTFPGLFTGDCLIVRSIDVGHWAWESFALFINNMVSQSMTLSTSTFSTATGQRSSTNPEFPPKPAHSLNNNTQLNRLE